LRREVIDQKPAKDLNRPFLMLFESVGRGGNHMSGRKSVPVGAFFMILVLALATVGVGFGLWSKLLVIKGTVETGKVDAMFAKAFTDDDNTLDDQAFDLGDEGPCPKYGSGACDPARFGPNPGRYDKDVGKCVAVIDRDDKAKLHVTVENAYPSYHCTVWMDIKNSGTIPVKIQKLTLKPVNFEKGEVTLGLSELACGQQIDPEKVARGDIHLHVEQNAEMRHEYKFDAELLLVQWNEFKPCGD
jgi:hypothetical protein